MTAEEKALPEGWVEATVADITNVRSGFGFPKKHQGKVCGDYPFAKVGDISRAFRRGSRLLTTAENYVDQRDLPILRARTFPAGSVAFPKIGESLRGNYRVVLGQESLLDNNVMALIPEPEVDSDFLYRIMSTVDLYKLAVSTAVPSIRAADVGAVRVPLPPLAEQRRIVEKIEALTARSRRARGALEALPALLGRYRASVLAAAFRSDLTKDWREANPGASAAELLAVVPQPTQPRGGKAAAEGVTPGRAALSVNHPHTELPQGWQWTPLLRVARQETGHTPSRGIAEYWDGDIPWIGIRDAGANHGGLIMDTVQHVTQAGLDNSSARLLPKGTVCLSRTASVGYVVIMGRDMATSQDFVTWTCSEALEPKYLMYALLAEGDDIRRFGKGSTHTTIYFPEVRALHIALPPMEEQREIIRRVEASLKPLKNLWSMLEAQTARLSTLDQSILAKAFRGELVPQDPTDEPASALLDRIRARRAAEGPAPKRRGKQKASG